MSLLTNIYKLYVYLNFNFNYAWKFIDFNNGSWNLFYTVIFLCKFIYVNEIIGIE